MKNIIYIFAILLFITISFSVDVSDAHAQASGVITATPCTIAIGASTCTSTLNWSTANLTANPTAVTTNNPVNNTQVSTATSGTNVNFNVTFQPTTTFYLFHNTAILAWASIGSVGCATGSVWNNTICAPVSQIVTTSASPSVGGTISPTSSVNYGSTKVLNITANTGYTVSIAGSGNGCSSGSFTGSFPNYTYTTGAITADCSVTATFTSGPSGNISATSCTIPVGASTCTSTLNWTTRNLTGNPTAVTTNNPVNNTQVSTATSGTNVSFNITFQANTTFYLFHNAAILSSVQIGAIGCALGSTWSGGVCTPVQQTVTTAVSPAATGTITPTGNVNYGSTRVINIVANAGYVASVTGSGNGCSAGSFTGTAPNYTYTTGAITANCTVTAVMSQMTGTLTAAPSNTCTISTGGSSCTINFSWTTTNPVSTSTVTSNTNNSGATSSNFLVAGPANSGGPTAFTVPYLNGGSHVARAFYLYNNSIQLATVSATAECASTDIWNGSSCVSNLSVPTLGSSTASAITNNSAYLGATVTSPGFPATLTARGTCYSTTQPSGYNGVFTGGSFATSRPGFGNAASFNGSTYIDMTDRATTTTDLTYSAWVYPNATASNWIIGNAEQSDFKLAANRTLYVKSPSVNFLVGPTIATGTWTHIAVTISGTEAKLYINGVLDTTNSSYGVGRLGFQTIGRRTAASGAGELWNGLLDEVRIYNRALNASEVVAVRDNAGAPGDSLVLYYDFNNDTTASITDKASFVTTNCAPEGGTSSGSFLHSRTGLAPNTTYYYNGYAANATGTGYSPSSSFTTTLSTTASILLNPTSIFQGSSSTLTWSSANATSCVGTNFSTGGLLNNPTGITVNPLNTVTYTITCDGVPASATLTVKKRPGFSDE